MLRMFEFNSFAYVIMTYTTQCVCECVLMRAHARVQSNEWWFVWIKQNVSNTHSRTVIQMSMIIIINMRLLFLLYSFVHIQHAVKGIHAVMKIEHIQLKWFVLSSFYWQHDYQEFNSVQPLFTGLEFVHVVVCERIKCLRAQKTNEQPNEC